MKITFKTILATVLLIIAAQDLSCQKLLDILPDDPLERSSLVTQWMGDRLNLSQQELLEVQTVNERYAKLMQPILESGASPLEKLKSYGKLMPLRIEETKALLNTEQWKAIEDRWRMWKSLLEKFMGILDAKP